MVPTTKPWADGPLALILTPMFVTKKHDMWTHGASHMAMVHNSIFRGYNSIYHQAPHITDADKPDFIGYCLTWHKFLKTHADNEDNSLFLHTEEVLKDKTIFEESHKEHEAFMPGLAQFEHYLTTLPTPTAFSAPQLLQIMASFETPFSSHMHSEIQTIANFATHPNCPAVGSALEKKISDEFDKREGIMLIKSGVTDVMPFFLFNFDRDYEDGLWVDWPPIPAPVRWGILRFAQFRHPGWWKFASCNAARERIPLYACQGVAPLASAPLTDGSAAENHGEVGAPKLKDGE